MADDPALIEAARRLICEERLPLRRAGRILGIAHQRAWKIVRENFPDAPRRKHVAKFHVEKIVAEKLAGRSAEKIAAEIGCNVRHVYTIVQKFSQQEIADSIGVEVDDLPVSVRPYRCPTHGLVRFKPCVACQAIAASRQGP